MLWTYWILHFKKTEFNISENKLIEDLKPFHEYENTFFYLDIFKLA